MKRSWVGIALVAGLSVAAARSLQADVRTDQKTKFQLAGALGRVVNMFGGRSAREGVTSMVAVKGSRKITLNDSTGQIIDLSEEKIYDLDVKKKQYTVTTFAELRRQIEESRRKAEEEARKEQGRASKESKEAPPERDPNAKEYEVDFDVKNTGEKKQVNGFDTHQAIVTVTVREKGKTLEQSGGMVMTSDMWLTPRNPALKEIQDFDLKYAQLVYGALVVGASPQDMASALAMYPQIKPAMERLNREGSKIDGTPVLTTVTMDGVKSAEQMAEEAKAGGDSSAGSSPTSISGAIGGLMRRRQQPKDDAQAGPKNRATFLTTSVEVLKLTTDVPADVVSVPAGYKESK